jgi:hypothetical protein
MRGAFCFWTGVTAHGNRNGYEAAVDEGGRADAEGARTGEDKDECDRTEVPAQRRGNVSESTGTWRNGGKERQGAQSRPKPWPPRERGGKRDTKKAPLLAGPGNLFPKECPQRARENTAIFHTVGCSVATLLSKTGRVALAPAGENPKESEGGVPYSASPVRSMLGEQLATEPRY